MPEDLAAIQRKARELAAMDGEFEAATGKTRERLSDKRRKGRTDLADLRRRAAERHLRDYDKDARALIFRSLELLADARKVQLAADDMRQAGILTRDAVFPVWSFVTHGLGDVADSGSRIRAMLARGIAAGIVTAGELRTDVARDLGPGILLSEPRIGEPQPRERAPRPTQTGPGIKRIRQSGRRDCRHPVPADDAA
jgi:hypothetical protein